MLQLNPQRRVVLPLRRKLPFKTFADNLLTKMLLLQSCYVLFIIAILGCCCFSFTTAASSSSFSSFSMKNFALDRRGGVVEMVRQRWSEAKAMATLEQEVEDWNAQFVAAAPDAAQASTRRRLICQPLEEAFDPPMGSFSHGHLQTGDKMSLPRVFWAAIHDNNAQVPWLFQVSRIEGVTNERYNYTIPTTTTTTNVSSSSEEGDSDMIPPPPPPPVPVSLEALDKVVGGPLDFRAPANYVFLPWWMMRALGLQPRDVVDVQLIQTVAPGSMAKFRPHSSEFRTNIAQPQAVMETELRHYSSLTKGTTIAFDYNKKRYWFDVVELRSAPRGEKQPMVKVQDCDIMTDFLVPKDELQKKKAKTGPKE